MQNNNIDKQVVLITGTSRGIGLGLAQHFIKKGFYVEGASRSPAAIKLPNYFHTMLDVCNEDAVAAWVRGIKRRHGRIDVVINNAGLALAAVSAFLTPAKVLEKTLQTNVVGSFLVSREAAKVMAKHKSGRIINFSSMAVGLHEEGTAAYAASKSAIAEFSRIMAKEFAPLNITCNVIAPSMIKTAAVEALGKEVIASALGKLTIKRTVTIEEICHILEFLIDPLGAIVTGQVIYMGLVAG